jgi:hypothetical protein
VSNLKLVPDDPTPLEKILLDASRAELPSEEHKAKLRVALGICLPLSVPPPPVSTTAPVQPAPAAPVASSPTAAPVAAAAAKSGVALKVALGAGALALAGAFAFLGTPDAPRQGPGTAGPALAAPVAAKAVAAPAPVAPLQQEALPEVSPLPPVEQAAPARGSRGDSSASSTEDLSEQIRLIEAARAGVASQNAKAALSALDSYAAKFPRGSFGQEATVLRIRAVDQSGDSARATAMAKSFVARFPNSPHVARLKPIAERGSSR